MKLNDIKTQQEKLDLLVQYLVPKEDLSSGLESKIYYLLYSDILESGELLTKVSGIEKNGERWDGTEVVSSEHPKYKKWKNVIDNQSQYIELQESLTESFRKLRQHKTSAQ